MNRHIDIFNNIFAIKDKISDNDFLEINNKLQKLIQENEELRNKINTQPEEETDEEYTETEEDEESEEEQSQCTCTSKWKYLEPIVLAEDMNEYFCLESEQCMKKCENFKKLLEDFPQLENLFNKVNFPFVEDQIEQEYVKNNIVMTVRIFIGLIDKFRGKKNKAIISFIIYEYLIKNINFLKDNEKFTQTVSKKFEEFIEDTEYVQLAQEYNVNLSKWNHILKSVSQNT